MAHTKVTVNLPKNIDLHLSTKAKAKWLFSFTPLGTKNMSKPDSLDSLDVICQFNKAELHLLKLIKDNINKHNIAVLKRSTLTKSDQRKLDTSLKAFTQKGLIKRIQKEHYLVNPYFLVPNLDYHQVVLDHWNTL